MMGSQGFRTRATRAAIRSTLIGAALVAALGGRSRQGYAQFSTP